MTTDTIPVSIRTYIYVQTTNCEVKGGIKYLHGEIQGGTRNHLS